MILNSIFLNEVLNLWNKHILHTDKKKNNIIFLVILTVLTITVVTVEREREKKKIMASTSTLLCPPIQSTTCGKQLIISMGKKIIIILSEYSKSIIRNKKVFIRTHLWPRKMPDGGESKRNRGIHVCPWYVSNWVYHDRHYESSCKWCSKLWHHPLINLA